MARLFGAPNSSAMCVAYLLIFSANLLCLCGMSQTTDSSPDSLQQIAYKLRNITIMLHGEINEINPTILLALNRIVTRLDARYEISSRDLLATPPPVPDTCGEVYRKHPFKGYSEFIVDPLCKQKEKLPIHELISILMLDKEQDINSTLDVLQTIHSYNSNITIILGSPASDKEAQNIKAKYKQVDTVLYNHTDLLRPGKILNLMAEKINTPYVLLARDLFYFNDLARLEKQVFVISRTNVVGIAGGAFRNETGYWKVGCHFSEIKNFFLQYTEGYKYSTLECMLCDHLEGPFVARTSIMKGIYFMDNLYEEVLFEDWFLRVKQAHILTMSCPEVMYFKRGLLEGVTNEAKLREHSSWLGLAKEWQVDHVQFPSRVSIKFTCKEVNLTCNRKEWSKTFLIPSCCMEQVTEALKELDTFSVEKGVDYEIESGTLLGAVKSRNILPWNENKDISFLSDDVTTFYENRKLFQEKGFNMTMVNSNQLHLNTPEITLGMWGKDQTSTYQLPTEMRKYPTRVKINGIWVRGEWNPGLILRKRFGSDF